MLYHHGSADYNVAASEAAKSQRAKFEQEIESGKARAQKVIEQIFTQIPEDRVVQNNKLTFTTKGTTVKVQFPALQLGDGKLVEAEEGFHRHAIQQAASRAGIPLSYIDHLQKQGEWGAQLTADNLNELFHHMDPKQRALTRSVNGEVRGFMTDAYRRMDSRPIVEQFALAMKKYGAVPLDGYALDTKICIKAVLPYVFEPVPHEVMIFGVALENSDFGDGKLALRTFTERLWCTNRAIRSEEISKIHLGARLSEDLQLSQKTYELDSETMASATFDVMTKALSAESVNEFTALIQKAHEQKIDPFKTEAWLKKNLRKEEVEAVMEAYKSAEIEMLPPGSSAWRMSNAISWIANTKIEDEGRKLEVMKLAGTVVEELPAAA